MEATREPGHMQGHRESESPELHVVLDQEAPGDAFVEVPARRKAPMKPRPHCRRLAVDAFHERLATVGLAAAGRYGFALAGGYAVQAAGMLERPSEDVDLFTAWNRRGEFDAAVTAVITAYRTDELTVEVERRYDSFARLVVSARDRSSLVELGVDWRANEPIRMSIGPVLHPDDAIANKMSALYGRAQARDFIDIDAIVPTIPQVRE